jgi:hypothetical protein
MFGNEVDMKLGPPLNMIMRGSVRILLQPGEPNSHLDPSSTTSTITLEGGCSDLSIEASTIEIGEKREVEYLILVAPF